MVSSPLREDKQPSLAVTLHNNGKISLYDHGKSDGGNVRAILSAVGLSMNDLYPAQDNKPTKEAEYIYRDESGAQTLKKIKMRKSNGDKFFYWMHLENGKWEKKQGPHKPQLYGLESLKSESMVFIVEGEKDCLTMHSFGFPCVTLPDGGNKGWDESYTKHFQNLDVYIIPDNDATGLTYGQTIMNGVKEVANNVFLLDLSKVWPDIPKKADVSDLAAKKGADTACKLICDLAQSARPYIDLHPSDLSDAGNADVFSKVVKNRLLWCDALGWLVWDGKRWEPNEHAATALSIDFAQDMLSDAFRRYKAAMQLDEKTGKTTVPDAAKQYLSHAQKTRSAAAIQHFLTLSKARLHIRAEKLDNEWFTLNTEAGLVDLRTGRIKPHTPAALCTRIAPFSPSDVGTNMWIDFLDRITQGDKELQQYIQIKVGSYAFGKIHVEGVDFAVGGGRNGKSTLFNALAHVFGDYAGGIDSTILTTDKQNRGAALATLRGKRLITCGELEEGQRLSVQTLKRIASTDPLTIEEKYKQPETIQPSHHVVLFSNFLPRVGSTDNGTWRRISVIPFNATMPTGKADIPNYADELATKAGGAILSWIIEGAKLFYEAGYHITPPESVQDATNQYKQREDWLQNFIAERCILEANARAKCGELYGEYKLFAQATGDYCRRGNDFARSMEQAGFRKVTVNGRPQWVGLRIDYALSYEEPTRQAYYS